VAGFKNNGLTDGPLVFWVPIVGPLVGGLIGGAAYDFGVRKFLPVKTAATV
jgi:glycerol uptake facilitator protein